MLIFADEKEEECPGEEAGLLQLIPVAVDLGSGWSAVRRGIAVQAITSQGKMNNYIFDDLCIYSKTVFIFLIGSIFRYIYIYVSVCNMILSIINNIEL